MGRSFAQTNIQLYQQLRCEGYSNKEIGRVCQAYELARELFCCLYRPSGKTFISHLVGIASILGFLHVPWEIVTAGLLHSAYPHGDFGTLCKGVSDQKRHSVKEVIGKKSEDYVARYAALLWNRETRLASCRSFSNLEIIDRNVLLMRLANELEDQLDRGILYCHDGHRQIKNDQACNDMLVKLAEQLGYPELGSELNSVFYENLQNGLCVNTIFQNTRGGILRKIPFSYRQRFPHWLYQSVSFWRDRVRIVFFKVRE